jgi:hypothetical protein
LFKVRRLHTLERDVGPGAHLRRDMEVRPERRGGKESCRHGVEASCDAGALSR